MDAENISEIACLEAMSKQCQQLVLMGDHLQQITLTNNAFSSSRGFGISLFERLIREGIRPFLLCQNYKISFHVLQFTSKYFYKNLVFPTSTKQKEKSYKSEENFDAFNFDFAEPAFLKQDRNNGNLDNYIWPNSQIKINFLHVQGYEFKVGDSIANLKELELIVHTTLYLFKTRTIQKEQLCIVTPYRSQNELILQEFDYHIKNNPELFDLSEMEVNNLKSIMDIIHVRTQEEIDRRYDFVIFSTVRSNKMEKLGSLRDPRRLNAVMSRTNEALIVIGDVFTLDNEQIWREFITWCKDRGLLCQYLN